MFFILVWWNKKHRSRGYPNHRPGSSVRLWGCTTLKIGKPSKIRSRITPLLYVGRLSWVLIPDPLCKYQEFTHGPSMDLGSVYGCQSLVVKVRKMPSRTTIVQRQLVKGSVNVILNQLWRWLIPGYIRDLTSLQRGLQRVERSGLFAT